MIAIVGGAAVFFAIWALYFQLGYRREKAQIKEKISEWVPYQGKNQSWSDDLADRLDQTGWAKRLAPQLQRASISLRPSEYAAVVYLGGGIAVFFIFSWGLGAPKLTSIGLALAITQVGSMLFLKSRKNIYVGRINAQLSEACRMLSSATRAGLSIAQGLELVVKEMPSPIKDELATVVREVQLGRDLEGALKDMLKRVNSRDLQVFVNALIIQRRAGGDLARVLSEMARTMEERKIIHKTIDAVMAQSRYSAYAMPVVSFLIVIMMSKMIDGFFDMFTQPFGIILVIIFGILQVIGFLMIQRIANIRV